MEAVDKTANATVARVKMSGFLAGWPAAMATWAAMNLSARLIAAQVAKLLNCSTEDVALLVTAGKLKPLGKPNANAVKFFSSIELMTLLADRDWLDDATKTIGQFWKRKNAKRHGLPAETAPANMFA
jgi:hypothetical protein